ncbi:copper resistance protein CopC [Rhodoblastus sp.]|jgi:methionine-rich copper-binding protein CopC|uniref:copper resistance CopC family protein n=1 Tax=Rhodoblastus sp. TaxID=1962975 RepID=UPI0025DEF21C|nr:copper resistance protein CopC [Rhodoblastus sp.]
MKRKIQLVALAAVVLNGFPIGGAWAHAHLKNAILAPDSVVATAPQEVRIEFSEKVEMSMSARSSRSDLPYWSHISRQRSPPASNVAGSGT